MDSLSDDDLIERLIVLKGIGRWTAETALVRGLIRPDVFPAGDLAVVKYLAQSLLGKTEKASEAEMRAFAERWRPYRGLALVYCYAEMGRRPFSRASAAGPPKPPWCAASSVPTSFLPATLPCRQIPRPKPRWAKRKRLSEAEMRAFAERWRPYRGLALVYCYAEMGRRRSEG